MFQGGTLSGVTYETSLRIGNDQNLAIVYGFAMAGANPVMTLGTSDSVSFQ